MEMRMMSCVGFSSSIPKAAIGLGSSSSLCLGNPKLLNSGSGRVSLVSVNGGRRRNRGFTCNALFGLGVPELVVIAGVAALVFGPKKLPEVGRSIGKTVKSFQQAAKEFESELKKEPGSTEEDSSEKPIALGEQEKLDNELSSSKETA
ncbi:sec-independent protein translocase protein TATA, chloroplastic [Vigna unguiculata]|uniref:Sec-independent protein translocase protein TatA n=1 Tax=Vigna unguiculata TaxID=3917 RepID=A0A4D6KR87_VIGUN|nr:sec-independent protein translocase protein TATA, chloroplastic [Vigna unguiculata]QCD77639.1 sec-independent protein translocase protein TatA [Vigna unguiculata]